MPRLAVVIRATVVPYTTTTKGSTWRKQYQRYAGYKRSVRAAVVEEMWHSKIEMSERDPLRIAVICNKRGSLHVGDLTNILKGTEDGAQHKAYRDDCWVDQEVAMRALAPALETDAVLLVVQPLSEGPERFSDWIREVETLAKDWGFIL